MNLELLERAERADRHSVMAQDISPAAAHDSEMGDAHVKAQNSLGGGKLDGTPFHRSYSPFQPS